MASNPLEMDAETSVHGGRLIRDWLADGQRKYPRSRLLQSSADRGWTTLSAELRSHSAGRIVSIEQKSVEVVIALAQTDGPVTRTGAGRQEETRSRGIARPFKRGFGSATNPQSSSLPGVIGQRFGSAIIFASSLPPA